MERINLPIEFWENEYRGNYNDYLESEQEVIRYQQIAKIIKKKPVHKELLDLGCGVGTMEKYLPPEISVTGIDISEKAIEIAVNKHGGKYYKANVESYVPRKKYDIILFNESLYYFSNAKATVERYKKYLKNKGNIILSIYHPYVGHKYYNIFENLINDVINWDYDVVDHITINFEALRWEIICLHPPKYKEKIL